MQAHPVSSKQADTTERRKYHHATLARAVSLTAPSVRMVYVLAWHDRDEGGGHRAYPVVELQRTLSTEYRKPKRSEAVPRRGATHAEMERLGWQADWSFFFVPSYTPVLLDEARGLSSIPPDVEGPGTVGKLVPAPWPPEEDAERLAPIVAKLMDQCRPKARAKAKPKTKRAR
jgi:hypothetical protein